MSKKINPLSFKLGSTQVWNNALNSYNSISRIYKINQKLLLFENYMNRSKSYSELSLYNCHFYNQKVLRINYASNKRIHQDTIKKAGLWFKTLTKVQVLKFTESNIMNALTINTLFNMLTQTSVCNKKMFNDLIQRVASLINKKRIMFGTKGLIYTTLAGYRIKCGGCFDKSRNKMSQKVRVGGGKNSFSSLYSFTEYRYLFIHTKSGTIGVHLWLFYKPCH